MGHAKEFKPNSIEKENQMSTESKWINSFRPYFPTNTNLVNY